MSRRTGGGAGTDAAEDGSTGASDELYGVVSILYHALQGAQTYEQYIEDAEAAGDAELVEFFRTCQSEEKARAQQAKILLAARIEEEDADEEGEGDEDEEGDEEEE